MKDSKDYGGSKNIVLGNTKNQTTETKTDSEKDFRNLNTGETSLNDLFSRRTIKSRHGGGGDCKNTLYC